MAGNRFLRDQSEESDDNEFWPDIRGKGASRRLPVVAENECDCLPEVCEALVLGFDLPTRAGDPSAVSNAASYLSLVGYSLREATLVSRRTSCLHP